MKVETGDSPSPPGAARQYRINCMYWTILNLALLVNIVIRYTKGCPGSRHDTIGGMKKLALSDYQALAEFRYQIRRYLHFSEQVVKKAGLERGQYQLMLAIKGMPADVRPRIRELANRMQIRHHSAVELINRLEARGFVHRTRAQDDKREVLLALTQKGEKVLGELALHHHDALESAGPELVKALRRVMRDGNADMLDSILKRTHE
jgi:DNA-binding MarR family transcriptional regulator